MAVVGDQRPRAPDRLDQHGPDPLLRRLFPAFPTEVEWHLGRTERALRSLHDPQRAFEAFHIGGTNGKGSVTRTIAAALGERGLRVGCYTSPHLVSFRERVLVNGQPMAEAELVRCADDVREAIERFGLTFFEAATVLAFHAFAQADVEVAAIEVGLGGRLDATNVLTPVVSAVTNVALDHADYLGSSLTGIAREKAGIAKPGVPFLTAERTPELLGALEAAARRAGSPTDRLAAEDIGEVHVGVDGTSFRLDTATWGALDLRTPLAGRHQATNAALAVRALELAPERLRPSRDELVRGVATVEHPGRGDARVVDGRAWVFDIAHNAAGVASLVDTLARLPLPRPWIALVAGLGDKEWGRMLPLLLSSVAGAILTQAPSAPVGRRWAPERVASQLDSAGVLHLVEDFPEALRSAEREAGRGTVIVTGSAHTVGSAMALLGLDPLG